MDSEMKRLNKTWTRPTNKPRNFYWRTKIQPSITPNIKYIRKWIDTAINSQSSLHSTPQLPKIFIYNHRSSFMLNLNKKCKSTSTHPRQLWTCRTLKSLTYISTNIQIKMIICNLTHQWGCKCFQNFQRNRPCRREAISQDLSTICPIQISTGAQSPFQNHRLTRN